jgi:hypothetical protein
MALRAGIAGAIGSAIVTGSGLRLPPSPLVALIGTAAMVPVFWGLLQLSPVGGRHLTWACGGLVMMNTLFLAFIFVGAAFPGAFAINRGVGLAVMALMLVQHLQQRLRTHAVLVLLALLAALAGYGGLAIVLKGLWLLALGMWLMLRGKRRNDDPRTFGEAISR